MDELKELLKEKIELCVSNIRQTTTSNVDLQEAQAVEHLTRALSYLYHIKEDN